MSLIIPEVPDICMPYFDQLDDWADNGFDKSNPPKDVPKKVINAYIDFQDKLKELHETLKPFQ